MRTELEYRVSCPPPRAEGNDPGNSAEANTTGIRHGIMLPQRASMKALPRKD